VYLFTAEVYQSGSEAEERLLPPSYHQLTNSQQRNIIRPKPLKLPVDAQAHQRERKSFNFTRYHLFCCLCGQLRGICGGMIKKHLPITAEGEIPIIIGL
jgi:hypothetical protein